VGRDVEVVSTGAGSASTRGLWACGSAWTCPQCAGAVMGARRGQIQDAAGLLACPVMVTLTAPHRPGESLREVRARVQKGWSRATSGRAGWREEYVRVMEVTRGAGGWNVHFHVLCEASRGQGLVDRWLAVMPGASGRGQHPGTPGSTGIADYLTRELVGARVKGRSQWALLRRAVEGDPEAVRDWAVFEQEIRGARLVTWSRSLAARVKGAVDADGSFAAEGDDMADGGAEVRLCRFTSEGWSTACGSGIVVSLMGALANWDFKRVRAIVEHFPPGAVTLDPWVLFLSQEPPERRLF